MPRDLLAGAVEQARERELIVRAMTLLSASRVLSAIDTDEAHRIYADGVAVAPKQGEFERAVALLEDRTCEEARRWTNSTTSSASTEGTGLTRLSPPAPAR